MNYIEKYLKKNKLSQSWLAAECNCSRSAICMIASGVRRPSPDLAMKIQRATGGKVTVMELLYGDSHGDRCEDAA